MRIEGQNAPKAQAPAGGKAAPNLEQQMKDYPRADSLKDVLRNPDLKKKLEEKIGPELVAKLDKIFNAQAPGMATPEDQAAMQMPQMPQLPQIPGAVT
jgi:hypothetical protein